MGGTVQRQERVENRDLGRSQWLGESQGNYLDVLPKDLLSLTAEYQGPNLIVSRDNEEEITFTFITPLLDFSKRVALKSIDKEEVIAFIDAVQNRQSIIRPTILSLTDRKGLTTEFYCLQDLELYNKKIVDTNGIDYRLVFFIPSLLVNKFCKALADLVEVPFVLEKSVFTNDKIVSSSSENLESHNMTTHITTNLLSFSLDLPLITNRVATFENFIRTVKADSPNDSKVETSTSGSLLWHDHRLMFKADESESFILKDEMKDILINVMQGIVNFNS